MQTATAAAWDSPWSNAATAAANVLAKSEEQGAFKLPAPLSAVVRGFALPPPPPSQASPPANAPRPPPPADPGIVARLGRWIRANPVLAALAGAAVVGAVWLIRRKA
jgi:hypothetical protein